MLPEILRGRRYSLITSPGWARRGAVDRLQAACPGPIGLYEAVTPNPTIAEVGLAAARIGSPEVIVALGGGSVIDTAKAAAFVLAGGGSLSLLGGHLESGVPLPAGLECAAIVAVPTTAGTGSEVSQWGTIWGEGGAKHSVSDRRLYPSHAILDPDLCLSLPPAETLAGGLDALSHAMEAVWNRRHSPVTDALAEQAIRMIRRALPQVLTDPADRAARSLMQAAALLAGVAMSVNQTALAHSISYPFTSKLGMPHGLACSFTLAEIARFNAEIDAERMLPIARGFECPVDGLAGEIETFLVSVGLPQALAQHLGPVAPEMPGQELVNPARAGNNLRVVDEAAARAIVRAALRRMLPASGGNHLRSDGGRSGTGN